MLGPRSFGILFMVKWGEPSYSVAYTLMCQIHLLETIFHWFYITKMFVWLRHGTSGLFYSASARFFAAAAEIISAKQRKVRLQSVARHPASIFYRGRLY